MPPPCCETDRDPADVKRPRADVEPINSRIGNFYAQSRALAVAEPAPLWREDAELPGDASSSAQPLQSCWRSRVSSFSSEEHTPTVSRQVRQMDSKVRLGPVTCLNRDWSFLSPISQERSETVHAGFEL